MTMSEAYDRLLAAPVSVIEWRDASAPLRCPEPMIVRHVSSNEHAEASIETSEEGLCLHFNARPHPGDTGKRGFVEPLSNIARIA